MFVNIIIFEMTLQTIGVMNANFLCRSDTGPVPTVF